MMKYPIQQKKNMSLDLHWYKAVWHKDQKEQQRLTGGRPTKNYEFTDYDFDRWFLQSYKPPSPTNEQLVDNQFRKEDAAFYDALKAEQKLKEREARECETSESLSETDDENLHEQIEEKIAQLRNKKLEEEKIRKPFTTYGANQDVKVTAAQLAEAIEDVHNPKEFFLEERLPEHVSESLKFFNVKTQDKTTKMKSKKEKMLKLFLQRYFMEK